MNKPTVQDIFHRFYPAYLEKYTPSPEQAKAARNIINCKTGAYGANVSICEDCGAVQIHYNSCRNRCCPMCQAVPKEKWMDARREDVLDAPYFHLVFTVPDLLNPIIYSNQKLLYDAFYHAASATIRELTEDPRHLGAKVGYIFILHTWGSEMNFHPHIHTILLGGGLTSDNQWKDKGESFFLPVQVISKVFRGKYLEELKTLWEEDKLIFHGTSEKFRMPSRNCWMPVMVQSGFLIAKRHFMVLNRSLNISESIPIGLRSVTTGSSVWTKKPSHFP